MRMTRYIPDQARERTSNCVWISDKTLATLNGWAKVNGKGHGKYE